ncbi:sugar phosphate isomerase/epimerase family protein [Marinobacterium litorale]|uniref:sugar phosphate isomerase/epimerase family protein n=1 Tax=Marinobacterium litorale TaxID=404770 RepID=UPI0003F99620|nr:TIM barrel protein [Marinobacterium litorale]
MAHSHPFALGPLTVLDLQAPEIVSIAADIGYNAVGLRLEPATPGGIYHPLMEDRALLKETVARMRDTGIEVFDLEIVRINKQFNPAGYSQFFDTGAELGAKCILVAADDPNIPRFSENFAAFCDAAAPYNLKPNLEFMPWTQVKDLSSAIDILAAINRPNAGVLIDAIHFDRSNSLVDDIERVPLSQLHYAQICDAPAEKPATEAEIIRAAREERLLPGSGGIPLKEIFSRLPEDLPICVEVPNASLGDSPTRAKAALAATKAFFADHFGQA